MSAPLNVEGDEIANVARVFDATADVAGAQGELVAACTFTAVLAGRSYGDSGTAVHGGVQKVVAALQQWSTQAHGIATAMRGATGMYGSTDGQTATKLAGQR